jgi:ectoine hydroxylase-related dioxygenase (phytanoyl-CoA dioxygenase family)
MAQENHKLTEEQIQHFNVFGFVVRRNVFSSEELAKMNDECDRRLAAIQETSDPEKNQGSYSWFNRNPETPFTSSLLEDPRIYVPSEQLVGDDSIPINTGTGSVDEGIDWHPDRQDHHMCILKNLMYLRPTNADRGALRVIPGSHKDPMHKELLRIELNSKPGEKKSHYLEKSGLRGEDIPCYIFNSNPGDIIILNELIWHAAYSSYKDRRLCYFNFYRNPKSPEQTESMRKEVKKLAETNGAHEIGGLQYHPWWLENPDNNPRRKRWISWLKEWGFVESAA